MSAAQINKADILPLAYQVIESLNVENFRCFKKLQLKGLKRINVIVGENASGKTALLESLFATIGTSAEIVFRLKRFRGYFETFKIQADRRAYESLWRDFFFDFDESNAISIMLQGSHRHTRSLKIT